MYRSHIRFLRQVSSKIPATYYYAPTDSQVKMAKNAIVEINKLPHPVYHINPLTPQIIPVEDLSALERFVEQVNDIVSPVYTSFMQANEPM